MTMTAYRLPVGTAGSVKDVAPDAGLTELPLTVSLSTSPALARPPMLPPTVTVVGPPLELLPLLLLLLPLLLELELELLLLELLLTPPLELLLELLELELLELLLLELLLLELLLGVVLSLPPPQATRMTLAQTANVRARTEARLKCRGRVECMCLSSSRAVL
jgi:hypothetical protein